MMLTANPGDLCEGVQAGGGAGQDRARHCHT